MLDKIHLKDVLTQVIIGVKDPERQNKQNLVLNATLWLDLQGPAETDSISQSPNYAHVTRTMHQFAEKSSYYTLEAFAFDLCREVMREFPEVQEMTANVAKPRALGVGAAAIVELTRNRAQVGLSPTYPLAPPVPRKSTLPPQSPPPPSTSTGSTTTSPIVSICRRETFAASHRMYSPNLSEDDNQRIFGKCAHPNGHGHNYVVEVWLTGPVDEVTGMVVNFTALKAWIEPVLAQVDHRNISVDVHHFRSAVVSTAENICVWIWGELQREMGDKKHLLDCVRLHETEKNVVEYRGDVAKL